MAFPPVSPDSTDGRAHRQQLALALNTVQRTAAGALQAKKNLSDLDTTATARTNLGLGTAAVEDTGTSGAAVPLLNGANTWSGTQTFDGDVALASGNAVLATAAQTAAATSTTTVVSPARVNDHPGVAKAWLYCKSDGTILASHNVASVVRNSAGNYTVTWTTAFASANYACVASIADPGDTVAAWDLAVGVRNILAGSVRVISGNANNGIQADENFSLVAFGSQ